MYIHSLSCISALPFIRTNEPLPALVPTEGLKVVEPNYSAYIPPMQSRRMNKGLKMGLTAALDCLQQHSSDTSTLCAIEVGTALGLLKDSESFLANLIDQNEQTLNPTPFIQSTHNTVSGAIALSLKCHAHNMTFVQKGHSFEHALLDAEMMLNRNPQKHVLVGAVDERIDILQWLVQPHANSKIVGEAATFFLIHQEAQNAICKIQSYQTFKTKSTDVANEHLKTIMAHYDCINDKCPTIVWNAGKSQNLQYTNTIINLNAAIGYNPTGSAMALAIGAKKCAAIEEPVVVVNQFKEYWSVFELSK